MIFPKMYAAEGMNLKHAYFNGKGVLLRPTFIFQPKLAQNNWKKKNMVGICGWLEFNSLRPSDAYMRQ